jgi:hypothetical protein
LWRRNEIGSRPLDGEPLGLPRRPSGGAARTPLWRRRVLLGASNRDGGKRRRCTRRETAEVRPTRCTPRPAIQPRQANRADRLAPIIFIVCFASLLLYTSMDGRGGTPRRLCNIMVVIIIRLCNIMVVIIYNILVVIIKSIAYLLFK